MGDEDRIALDLGILKNVKLLFRDEQIEQIILSMNQGVSAFVYGPAGGGKTTAVRQAMEKFNTMRNRALYISCDTCTTEYSVLREIVAQINSTFVHKIILQERSNYELIRRLKAERETYPALKVIALDNLKSLAEPRTVDSLIEMGFAVILVSDDVRDFDRMSQHAQSSVANAIHFTPYSQEQALRIIGDRAKQLLREGRYDSSLVMKIARQCNGNMGQAQAMLVASAIRAIGGRKGRVEESDIPTVERKEELNDDERLIVGILGEKAVVQGGEMYRLYCERARFPKAERTFRDYMKDLAERNLVKVVGSTKGRVYEKP